MVESSMKGNSIFTREPLVMLVILINSIVIFLQEAGIESPAVSIVDATCTVFFIMEMVMKTRQLGFSGYWASGLNRMDCILVILSLPSLVGYLLPGTILDLSGMLILRLLRVFRIFRLVHIFPNFSYTMRGFVKALKDSLPVFVGFLVLIIIIALLSCSLFRKVAPDYFGTPWDSIYSIFKMCTVEGWYEIPDVMASTLSTGQLVLVRFYFILILILGGIIGLSLVNSIFVDAMVSDNNDNLESEVKDLHRKLDLLTEEIHKLQVNSSEGGPSGIEDPEKEE